MLHAADKIKVTPSDVGKKSYACLFCKKLVKKLPRHLENIHKNMPEVRKISLLPKKCKERKVLLSKLLRIGRFKYNCTQGTNFKLQGDQEKKTK